ncbi:MAG: TIR domain-containing protein [Anaerolineae bacterium]|nr:TIR domain-containing protein [Anaerolineae bacterium]MDQ7034565.1 TIR domain-containing protein [Anaerolineae bacterium]
MESTSIVYVSYHNSDYKFALTFANDLISNDIFVCLDRFVVSPIDNWESSLQHTIDNANLAIIVMSRAYLECRYCQRELQDLISKQTPLYTIFIEDVPINSLHDFVQNHDWFDFEGYENHSLYQSNLDKFIRKVFSSSNQRPALSAETKYLTKAIGTTEQFLFNTPFQQAALKIHQAINTHDVRPSGHAVKQFLQRGSYHLHMDDSSVSMSATNELNIANLIEWLNVRTQLLLTGQSGCGKTFIARHLLLYSLHERLQSGTSKPIPLWIHATSWHPDEALGSVIHTALPVDADETSVMLFIDEIDKLTTWQIDEIMQWLSQTDGTLIATARNTEKLQLSLATLIIPSLPDAALQRVSRSYLPPQSAKKFVDYVQNNSAVGFDSFIYKRLEFVGWQMLLFQEDSDDTRPQNLGEIAG